MDFYSEGFASAQAGIKSGVLAYLQSYAFLNPNQAFFSVVLQSLRHYFFNYLVIRGHISRLYLSEELLEINLNIENSFNSPASLTCDLDSYRDFFSL